MELVVQPAMNIIFILHSLFVLKLTNMLQNLKIGVLVVKIFIDR